MAHLADAIGRGEPMTLAGKTWLIEPLDMWDLAELEAFLRGEPQTIEEIQDGYEQPLSRLNILSLSHQLTILHLVLRKADPDLSPVDREAFRYGLTKAAVARLFGPQQLTNPETPAFIGSVLRLSGLLPEPGEASEAAEAPTAEALTPPKPRRAAKKNS